MSKKTIVILSGAGMSAESGLGTFRDSGGLWDKHKIEDVATPEAWLKDPKRVTEFYNIRRKQCFEAKPNDGHFALAELEKHYNVIIVTQNIDNLHERAGSSNVIHLHGEIDKVKSSGPNGESKYYDQKSWKVKIGDKCPEGYQLRPHVVWFGEAVPMLEKGAEAVEKADIFVVVGTSLNVYPAAGLIDYAPTQADKYLIDPNRVSVSESFSVLSEYATEGLKIFKEKMIHKKTPN
jgi:NAD-dependent deacetylase